MNKDKQHKPEKQVEIIQSQQESTRYSGAVAIRRLWKKLNVPQMIKRTGIEYGQGANQAAEMIYALTVGPLCEAHSVKKIAQRFGGEASAQGQEQDRLLTQQVSARFSQRTLCRFVNRKEQPWQTLQVEVVKQLQKRTKLRIRQEGVIVIDDLPFLKPYARKMAYLSTIYDSSHQRYELGYTLVHLYYYHPSAYSYSLAAALWHKRSLSGTCKAKPTHAVRAAKADEEQSKLDLALTLLESLLPLLVEKPTLVFDSWYCARWFVKRLSELGFAWISQASAQRKFTVAAGYLSTAEVIAHYHSALTPVPGFGKQVRAYALKGVIQPDKYTLTAQPVQLLLVQGLFAKDKPGTIRLLICNRRRWSMRRILSTYGYRTKIEQSHRTGKQEADWGAFHSRAWPTLQAHCALALLRSLLLTLLAFTKPALRSLSFAQLLYQVMRVAAQLHPLSGNRLRLVLPRGHPALLAALF
jgi:hypothetical protein